MPSIVPKNPAPIPPPGTGAFGLRTMAGAGGGGGTLRPPLPGYAGTDWGRLGQPVPTTAPGPVRTTRVDPITGQTYETEEWPQTVNPTGSRWAIPPGFSEASIPSRYGVAWRGAAFGPQGRLTAPVEKRYPPGGGQGEGPGTGTFNPGPTSTGPLPEQPIGPWPTAAPGPGEQPTGPWPTVTPGAGTYQPAPWGPIPVNPPPLPGPNGPIPIGPGGVPQLPPPPVPMPTEPVTTYVPVGRPGTGTVKQPTNQWWVQPKTVNTTYKPR